MFKLRLIYKPKDNNKLFIDEFDFTLPCLVNNLISTAKLLKANNIDFMTIHIIRA